MERDTAQRRAIRKIFEDVGRPLSPQEVLEEASTHARTLGIATVYRNVKSLVESGWLVPVGLPGEPDRYEIAGKEHHHHFRCRGCERVFEIGDCPGNIQALVPEGFRMESHDLTLYGLCDRCAKTPSIAASPVVVCSACGHEHAADEPAAAGAGHAHGHGVGNQ